MGEIVCEVCGKVLNASRRALFAGGKWCHQACFKKLDVPIGTRAFRRYPIVPPCAASMGCLCAGHARGNSPSDPCDTTEVP